MSGDAAPGTSPGAASGTAPGTAPGAAPAAASGTAPGAAQPDPGPAAAPGAAPAGPAEPHPPWLEALSFGDSAELRFPLVLMGVAILGFVTLVEIVDGIANHLEHIIPFSVLIAFGLGLRWHLTRRFPHPLGPG